MINPKTLDIKTLPWLPLEEKAAFPKKSAIYFAIDSQGTVQYIGRSANVRQRWGNHHKYDVLSEIGNIKIAYLFVDAVELLPKIEAALIEWFKPPLNNSLSSFTNTSEKINFTCEPEDKQYLREWAAREGRTLSNLVERIVKEAIAEDEVTQKKVANKTTDAA
ncbi:MAG: GIY-YIG nuclease family protein [Cyanobacteria bacterium P01_D01_bin.116]